MKQHRILVVGCGSIGQRHARILSERNDVDLYVADPVSQNLTMCCECANVSQSFTDYNEALDRGMDGVFVCTPNSSHVPIAVRALESGAHVMVEKPVAETVEEARRLLAVKKRFGKEISVGYVYRYDKLLQRLKQEVQNGRLGNVTYAHASIYTYRTLTCAKDPDYRIKTEYALIGDFTHDIDFLLYLLGGVSQVAAICAMIGDLDMVARQNVVEILLRFDCGAIGSIHMDYVRDPEKRSMELIGDRASAEFEMPLGSLRIYERGKDENHEIRNAYVRDDLFREQAGNFVGVLRGEAKPFVTLEDGIEALRVAEAAVESCKIGAFVTLN